jgi:hypothetical protein
MKRRKLITVDQAKPCKTQHRRACSDCPLRRDSVRGWLGGYTPEEYLALLHSDERIDCHTKEGPQCAGAAIYRENVCKSPRPGSGCLELPADKKVVFGNPMEFLKHHRKEG